MDGENDLSNFTYTVTKPNDDAFETEIEKAGIKVAFTPRQLINDKDTWTRKVKELKGTVELKRAECANIEAHHAFVKDMSMQDLFTAKMYYENKAIVDGLPPKIEEIEKELVFIEAELNHLADTLGLDIKEKTKEEVVDKAMEKFETPTDNG